jgi:hypothetical protein
LKAWIAITAAAAVFLMSAAIVSAEHGSSGGAQQFPSNSQAACNAHDGTWDNNDKTCTVESSVETKSAGNSGRGWTVDTETVYETSTGGGPPVETTTVNSSDCTNPGGKVLKNPNPPHCNP